MELADYATQDINNTTGIFVPMEDEEDENVGTSIKNLMSYSEYVWNGEEEGIVNLLLAICILIIFLKVTYIGGNFHVSAPIVNKILIMIA